MKNKLNIDNLVNEYSDTIYSIAIGYFKNKDDAEDIVQDVFTKYISCIKSGKNFKTEEYEKYWIIRVTMNLCCNKRKESNYKRNVPFIDKETIGFEFSESESLLLESIDKLEDKYRIVFELFYLREFKISEISKILKISEPNVKTRLRRAREKLKKLLQQGGYFDE